MWPGISLCENIVIMALLFSGHFMYIEVSPSNLNRGDFARLLSPRYPATQGSCLQFWYHMYGRTIGTLNVYIKNWSWSMSKVWSKSGNDSNIWNVAQVSISSRYAYQVFSFLNFKTQGSYQVFF